MLRKKQLAARLTLLLILPLWLSAISLASAGASETEQAVTQIVLSDVPTLIKDLQDDNPKVRASTAEILGNIVPVPLEAVPALIKALQDNDPEVRQFAANALGRMGPAAKKAVPALIQALQDSEMMPRISAAVALENMGPAAQEAIPALTVAFKDADHYGQPFAEAISKISQTYIDNMNDLGRSALKNEISQLEKIAVTNFKDLKDREQNKLVSDNLNRVIIALKAEYSSRLLTTLSELVEKHNLYDKWWAWFLTLYLALVVVSLPSWFLLFWLRPIWLYGLNEKVSWLSLKLPYIEGPVGLGLLFLLSPFHYCNRVLDAWVQTHQSQGRAGFAARKTVEDRAVHVPVPVTLNGHTLAQPSPQDFNGVFQKTPFCLLIWGEGGSGKTSLACQLAEWTMAEYAASSLTKHPMLPVLIEYELKIEGEYGGHPLLSAIHKQVVERLTGGQEISTDLLRCLLRQQRLLVIVDHFSELSPEARQAIQMGFDPQLAINAMIVTSRQKEEFQGSVTDTLKPLRIRGNHLSDFLSAYLTQLGKREHYDDDEFFAACGRLTKMVGDRNLTVLLARMFADQMIATKEEPASEGLPENIPDLMLSYLNWINRQESEKNPGNRAIHRIAKAISWMSLTSTFRPMDASLTAVHTALAAEPDLDQKLDYLCRDLGIIQCVGPAEDRMRVSLDPVAEYLAGWHLLELYEANDGQWRSFLEEANKKEGAPKAIEGFLLAVRDCCLAKGKEFGVPGFVEMELAQMTGINVENKPG